MIKLTSDKQIPRKAYNEVEDLLGWNYHYFLQRGSYEIETGDLELAKNFLEQARAMSSNDYMVQTAWAYMTLKRAAQNPTSMNSNPDAEEAIQQLEEAISARGKTDYYPYHVLGSQGLSWSRRALISTEQKNKLLSRLRWAVNQGITNHPYEAHLKQLGLDIEREYLMTAVPK